MGKAYDVMLKRRSIRKYLDKAVCEQDVQVMLEAAMAAPSGHNAQPWHFVVINDRATLDHLAGVHKYAKMLEGAPLCIAVCGQEEINGRRSTLWDQDCSAATQNILLAATELGLGSVWLGIYPNEAPCAYVAETLNIPDDITPFGLIVIGHPAEEKEARSQFDAGKVHYNLW